MEVTNGEVIESPHDFKKCKSCGTINWYENEVCISCGGTKFSKSTREIIRNVKSNIRYYITEEGYSEDDVTHNVWIEV